MDRNRFFSFAPLFTAVVTILLAGLFAGQPAFSQVETGSISGVVRDPSGSVLPSAMVTATNTATSVARTVQSGPDGTYTVSSLLPGIYNVAVAATGFQPFTGKAEVTVGGHTTLEVKMSLSTQTETVEVVGEGGATVNTQTQELSQLVGTTQMSQLPSLTRNPYDFVALSGNISSGDLTSNGGTPNPTTTVGQSLTSRGVGYSINGQRETGTEILLDGVENVGVFVLNAGQPVPVDSIQEFSVITNNFDSQYGRASGGIVNVDSKAGTNSIHGSAFEYNRLSAYTANTYGNVANDVPKGIYARNQFGYNIGGPIVKNKLFAYFSQEFTRVRSGANETEEVFDPSFLSLLPANSQAYFAKYGTGALPPSGTVVTAGQLAANSSFGEAFPLINGKTPVSPSQKVFDVVNFTAPFDAGGGLPQNTNDLLGRVDFNMTDKTQIFFRFARYNENDFGGSVAYSPYPQYNVGATSFDNSGMVSVNHVFSSNLLSNTKISATRFRSQDSYNTALTETPNLYLSTNNYAQQADPVTGNVIQLPGLENSAFGSGGLPFGGPQNELQIFQDVTWTRGRHTLHFGGQFTYIQLNIGYGAYYQANEVLGDSIGPALNSLVDAGGVLSGGVYASPVLQFQARVNSNGVLPCATDIYGNEIVTAACSVTPPLALANPARSYRYKDWALYAGDSFRLTPRLTINYALRYEHYGVQHNNHQNLDSNYYPGAGSFPQNIADGSVQLTTQSSVGQFWAPRWGTAAPRVGFAYDVFGDGKTALRGGFGISYERNFGNVTYNASFNPPASAVLSNICTANASNVITNCANLVTNNDLGPLSLPGPSSPLTPVELRDDDAHINVAQTQFWSLAIQRQINPSTILEVSYSGAHGVHLYDLNNLNLLGAGQAYLGQPLVSNANCPYSDPSLPPTALPVCYTRLNSAYTNINDRGSNAESAYDALNIKFQSQNLYHTGVTLVANYTWSHSLDDLSTTFSESQTADSLGYTDYLKPTLDWGSSEFDVRHRIVISPIWQTPWFKSGHGFETEVLGGWTVSSIFTARTGTPFSVYDESYLLNYYVIPRLTPATPITQYHTGAPVNVGHNLFTALNVPPPANLGPFNPTLGISDFGPFPKNMTGRNAFRGPGAWNDDLAIAKDFKLTERFSMQFRAEGFNVFNHHNFYVFAANSDYYTAPTTTGVQIQEEKGGLGNSALGGNKDERRFGQFSLRLLF
jgi:hypothetical protein